METLTRNNVSATIFPRSNKASVSAIHAVIVCIIYNYKRCWIVKLSGSNRETLKSVRMSTTLFGCNTRSLFGDKIFEIRYTNPVKSY